ncbi:MAG: hypothetical protein ABW321_33970, partial [Polyangiales bacterium]
LFGPDELALYTCDAGVCLPLSAAPLRLCVDKAWLWTATDAERVFGLTRAVAVAKFYLVLLARSAPSQLGLVLTALRQVADPAYTAAVGDAAEQARVAHELSQRIPETERARARNLFAELAEHDDMMTPRRLIAAAFDAGSRVALCVTGDVTAAFASLLRLRGRAPTELTQPEKLELCRAEPALRGLLAFAISETYSEVRREALRVAARDEHPGLGARDVRDVQDATEAG